MKKLILFLLFISYYTSSLYSVLPLLTLTDAPTAVTVAKGSYSFNLSVYGSGSLQVKGLVGLHDRFYLGASWDVEQLIGNGRIGLKIPGVIAKLKLFDQIGSFPILGAIGYDTLFIGNEGRGNSAYPYTNVVFGPYIVITKPLFVFKQEQHIHLGVQMPLQPTVAWTDTSLYWGIDWPIGSFFVPIFEMNKIYFKSDKLKDILYTIALRFNIVESLSVQLSLRLKYKSEIDRIVTFQYAGQF